MHRLVLASTSPYRKRLLERLGVPFTCERPGVDEDEVKRAGQAPLAVVQELARRKASAVAARAAGAIVVGSDQAAVLGEEILDKPGTAANAHAQLRRLAGREHLLLTAVAIVGPASGDVVEFVDATVLTMRALDDAAIERYVAAESPLDCAGSYKIEGLGITLFERIEAADQTAIEGLPLLRLCRELRTLGFPLP